MCKAPFMVALYRPGREQEAQATTCIDRYEFPNLPCEYPVTWVTTREAEDMCHVIGKRLCDALARSLEAIDENDLAFAWTQRWLALSPGDRRAIAEFLRRCQLGTDPARIADALSWVLAQPDPPESRLTAFLDALTLLFGLDRVLAGQVARRALDRDGGVAAAGDGSDARERRRRSRARRVEIERPLRHPARVRQRARAPERVGARRVRLSP